jgi:hypothetical protein
MRHEGMRVAVSTQSPKVLAPELLELVSVAVLHNFHRCVNAVPYLDFAFYTPLLAARTGILI